jgi:hypothetical protein
VAGTNTLTRLVPGYTDEQIPGMPAGKNYVYDALQGSFAFTKNPAGLITSGTSYILNGDSGGPTFQADKKGVYDWLVGVHQSTTINTAGGQQYAVPGNTWQDVNANQYLDWITRSCIAASVPEPSSWILSVIAGGVLLGVAHRNRNHRARSHRA